jgi:hypothetical protein
MKKGVTGSQNVAFLRWCAELGLQAHWNLIFGFPKEDEADYRLNLTVMRKIIHLRPPDGGSPIRLDRFSPNYANWKENGFSEIRPMPAYRHVFGLSAEDLRETAYYFDYDHPNLKRVIDLAETLLCQVDIWREKNLNGEAGELAVRPVPGGGYCLVDTRFGFSAGQQELASYAVALITEFDEPSNTERAIDRIVSRLLPVSRGSIQEIFDGLVESGVIAIIGNRAVTLALLPEELWGCDNT